MADGRQPASSRRITRCVSTCVLPEPALAETQAERPGSDAVACFSDVQLSQAAGSAEAGLSSSSILALPVVFRRRPFGNARQMVVLAAVAALLFGNEPGGEAVAPLN